MLELRSWLGQSRAQEGAGDERPEAERTATGHLRGTAAALLSACALVALAVLATAGPAAAQTAPEILVFHDGSDATTDAGIVAIQDLGTENGFGVTVSDDPADFTSANLEQYAAVAFLDADGDVLPEASQENALRAYVQDGHGFLGIGSTADAEQDSDFFDGLVGARPAGTEGGQQTVVFGDRVHPATRELPLMLDRTDQWYTWNDRPTGEVHTVARWHAPDDPAGDGTDIGGTDHPVSWCRDFQGGRSFYTAMGRTAGSYAEAEIQDHLLGAIQWTAGLVRADCKATICLELRGRAPRRRARAAPQPHRRVARAHDRPNGWVIYIGRGDCRTNAERGEVAGLPGPDTRGSSTSPDPNVGVGCGNVHIFDPAEHDGTVNSGATSRGSSPSTATAAAATRSTARSRRASRDHRLPPTSPRPGTSTSSTSRPSTRTTRTCRASPTAPTAAGRKCGQRGSRGSRSTSRPRSSTSPPRS